MKLVIGIILAALLVAALGFFLVLVYKGHDMTLCGDVANPTGSGHAVTRVYTTDLNANETLSEIVLRMNASDGAVSAEELTEILATYQNIIYAPVFVANMEQVDTKTYVLSGGIYNGIDDAGEPANGEYYYKDMVLTCAFQNGAVVAAQNVYPEIESGEQEFVERKSTIDPIITDENQGVAFSFRECDSFRMVFTATDPLLSPKVTMIYTYNVKAENPLNFTGADNCVLAYTMTVAYDDRGNLVPEFNFERAVSVDD